MSTKERPTVEQLLKRIQQKHSKYKHDELDSIIESYQDKKRWAKLTPEKKIFEINRVISWGDEYKDKILSHEPFKSYYKKRMYKEEK